MYWLSCWELTFWVQMSQESKRTKMAMLSGLKEGCPSFFPSLRPIQTQYKPIRALCTFIWHWIASASAKDTYLSETPMYFEILPHLLLGRKDCSFHYRCFHSLPALASLSHVSSCFIVEHAHSLISAESIFLSFISPTVKIHSVYDVSLPSKRSLIWARGQRVMW